MHTKRACPFHRKGQAFLQRIPHKETEGSLYWNGGKMSPQPAPKKIAVSYVLYLSAFIFFLYLRFSFFDIMP